MDAICYHAGGPLVDGRIVHADGRTCLQCPWHSYMFDIETGEGIYQESPNRYKSKGPRQRIHQVQVRQDQNLFIALNESSQNIASDEYAFRNFNNQ